MGIFSDQLPLKTMVPVCRQLATIYDAGIPILRGLEMVHDQLRDKRAKQVFRSMHDDVQRGLTLGEAAQNQARYLGLYFVALVRSGEHGGRLDVMLRDLAAYYEDRLNMRRSIGGMMLYPGIQIAFAWFCGTFALRLLGKIQGLISGGQFNFMAYLAEWGAFQLRAFGVFAAIFFCCAILARLGVFGYVWGAVATFIFPMAPITRRFALARFFRSLALLIGSGVHIVPCIESAAAVSANPYIEKDLLKAVPHVKQGATLTEAFSHVKYLTPTARELIFVGEQSGELDKSLHKISEYYMAEASHAVQVGTRFLGVAILLSIALLIGYIIVTFYTRLYGGIMNEYGI